MGAKANKLQSWTKLVKKIANFGHIFQSHLRNTPPEEQQTFTPPSSSLNVALKTMTQRQTNIDEGEGGCVVDVSS